MATIVLLGGSPAVFEKLAAAAITPGHLVEPATGGDAGKIKVHATAGGNAAAMFADVNPTPDRANTTPALTTAYATGEQVRILHCHAGDMVNALLAANAAAVVEGDFVESAGDGTVRKHTAPSQAVAEGGSASYTIAQQTHAIVGQAAEAVNNSAVAAVARLKIRIV
jgi:hypothetical protein